MIYVYYCTDAEGVGERELDALLGRLPDARRHQATAASPRRRRTLVLSWYLVRYAYLRAEPEREAPVWIYDANGKPDAPAGRAHFSLSHDGGLLAVALRPEGAVGVDVTAFRRRYPIRYAAYFCNSEECATIAASPDPERLCAELWCRKEATVKQSGAGVGADLRSVSVIQTSCRALPSGLLAVCPQEETVYIRVSVDDFLPPV